MLDWTRFGIRSLSFVCAIAMLMLAINGCARSPKRVIKQSGATTIDIMRGDAGEVAEAKALENSKGSVSRPSELTSLGHTGYTRDAINEVRQLFPTLPNPTIALYVHAHPVLDPNTGETLPVPAYTTAFPLYSRVQFAMPGELPASRNPVTEPFPAASRRDTDAAFADTESFK